MKNDYKVAIGENTATVDLNGSEREVIFDRPYNVFNVKSEGDVAVSLTPGKSEGDDGVLIAREDCPVFYPHMRSLDRVYLTGEGSVTVFASDVAVPVFKKIPRGGDNKPVSLKYIQDGLIAEWILDGRQDEILNNPSFVSDDILGRWVGKVMNGVSPSFYVKKTDLSYSGDIGVTLQCLANIDESVPQMTQFHTIGVNHNDFGSNVALGIGMNNSKKVMICTPSDEKTTEYTLSPDIWYHLAIVYKDDMSTIALYVNGEYVTVVTKKLQIPSLMSGAAIGAWVWSNKYPQASSSNRGNFKIANCCVYDRPLSNEEIAENYSIDKKRYRL